VLSSASSVPLFVLLKFETVGALYCTANNYLPSAIVEHPRAPAEPHHNGHSKALSKLTSFISWRREQLSDRPPRILRYPVLPLLLLASFCPQCGRTHSECTTRTRLYVTQSPQVCLNSLLERRRHLLGLHTTQRPYNLSSFHDFWCWQQVFDCRLDLPQRSDAMVPGRRRTGYVNYPISYFGIWTHRHLRTENWQLVNFCPIQSRQCAYILQFGLQPVLGDDKVQ
jgi:hypothetical protein